jgi:hypothetical protein
MTHLRFGTDTGRVTRRVEHCGLGRGGRLTVCDIWTSVGEVACNLPGKGGGASRNLEGVWDQKVADLRAVGPALRSGSQARSIETLERRCRHCRQGSARREGFGPSFELANRGGGKGQGSTGFS